MKISKETLSLIRSLPKDDRAYRHPLHINSSFRRVFQFGDNKVIKIAGDDGYDFNFAKAQIKKEIEVYKDKSVRPVITRIFNYCRKNNWLIAERVNDFKTESDFKKKTGIKFDTFIDYTFSGNHNKLPINLIKPSKLVTSRLLAIHNLEKEDIARYDHWGLTTNNRLVLLDYGLDNSM